ASLKDLADKLHCHTGYLGERIRAQFGKTFRQLLAERRVEESKVFLKLHREYTVGKIASLCGFDDSNYFSSVFRKITGISPAAYRKQHHFRER
ncbi:MAG: helix-turn-helix transcriptional regulator, partial [Lentisphaeria bacterium]|nr:helix-turn-helix transcriptional regulator [Lentisphaeria bacterium]